MCTVPIAAAYEYYQSLPLETGDVTLGALLGDAEIVAQVYSAHDARVGKLLQEPTLPLVQVQRSQSNVESVFSGAIRVTIRVIFRVMVRVIVRGRCVPRSHVVMRCATPPQCMIEHPGMAHGRSRVLMARRSSIAR